MPSLIRALPSDGEVLSRPSEREDNVVLVSRLDGDGHQIDIGTDMFKQGRRGGVAFDFVSRLLRPFGSSGLSGFLAGVGDDRRCVLVADGRASG